MPPASGQVAIGGLNPSPVGLVLPETGKVKLHNFIVAVHDDITDGCRSNDFDAVCFQLIDNCEGEVHFTHYVDAFDVLGSDYCAEIVLGKVGDVTLIAAGVDLRECKVDYNASAY